MVTSSLPHLPRGHVEEIFSLRQIQSESCYFSTHTYAKSPFDKSEYIYKRHSAFGGCISLFHISHYSVLGSVVFAQSSRIHKQIQRAFSTSTFRSGTLTFANCVFGVVWALLLDGRIGLCGVATMVIALLQAHQTLVRPSLQIRICIPDQRVDTPNIHFTQEPASATDNDVADVCGT